MRRVVKSVVFAMCLVMVLASAMLAFGQDGTTLDRHVVPDTPIVTNAWHAVSNKTDALVEKRIGPLRTEIAGKQNALEAWSQNPFSGWNGYYIAVPLAMWAQKDEQGHLITEHYSTKSELNTATNALQSAIDGKVSHALYESDMARLNDDLGYVMEEVEGKVSKSDLNSAANALQTAIAGKQDELEIDPSIDGPAGYPYAITSRSAYKDGSGNDIAETYSTKTELATKVGITDIGEITGRYSLSNIVDKLNAVIRAMNGGN